MERHLPFERGVNFRDLGGYKTADGARVKWRKLFRCGALNKLTAADQQRIAELQLHAICDFRGAAEADKVPSRVPEILRDRIRLLDIEPGGSFSAEDDILALVTGRMSADEISARVRAIYVEIATDFAPAYGVLFRHLQEAAGAPVLFHCAAGKDRTGIGAALILSALGVPEETILDDYMLSRDSVPLKIWLNSLIDHAAAHHPLPRPRDALADELMRIWGVSPDWLHAAFTAMHTRSGSVENYLREAVGVSDTDRDNLRRWYLER